MAVSAGDLPAQSPGWIGTGAGTPRPALAVATLAAAMGEALALLNDDEAQFETALDALVRGLKASFREPGC